MGFLKNLSIRNKLLLIVLLLFLPLAFFVYSFLGEIIRQTNIVSATYRNLQETKLITAFIHELQEERALTLGYFRSKKQVFGSRLEAQIELSDMAHKKLADYLKENEISFPETQLYYELQKFRSQFKKTLNIEEYENLFTIFRGQLMKRVDINKSGINDQKLLLELNSQVYLMNAKQELGRLRTLLNLLNEEDISAKELNDFNDYTTLYFLNIQKFLESASEEITRKYYGSMAGDMAEVNNLLNSFKNNAKIDLKGMDKVEWYSKFSMALEKLKEVESFTMNLLESQMERILTKQRRTMTASLVFTSLIVFLALFIAIYIIRFINDNITELKEASDRLSKGMTNIKPKIVSKDEFGSLAGSFIKMSERFAELSLVAENIGKGNYNIDLEIRSEEDILGSAIREMKENLKTLSEINHNRTWLLNGISLLNDKMSGETDLETASKKIIDQVCSYLSCEAGVIFLENGEQNYNFAAGHGIHKRHYSTATFTKGDGLTGEVTASKEIRILNGVEAANVKIRTAMSSSDPFSVLIAPLFYDENVIGVIELASRREFTKNETEFIREASVRIAIVLLTLKSSIVTRELLYETQNQAEELEVQQEELRKVNEELTRQTEHLQASEEELRNGQEELFEKNNELEVQNKLLQEARQAIELKIQEVETISRYKTEFLANMSHELRTPLNSIMILSKLLHEELSRQGLKKQSEQSQVIFNSGTDLLKLVNEILDLSKIEAGQLELDIKENDIAKFIRQKEFDQIAKEKNITFKQKIEEGLPPKIQTDEFRLQQILKNLLSNAFKFTGNKGNISLRIYALKSAVEFENISLQTAEDVIAFEIKDSGIGIPKALHKVIFEAFKQGDSSVTRKFGGTGLGLSISKELAHILGGEIRMESVENKGSTFTLYLPAKFMTEQGKTYLPEKNTIEPFSPSDTWSNPKIQPGKKTILIIEDDRSFNNILSDFIKSRGFQSLQAFNGKEGIAFLEELPDAIMLDLNLPDVDGWNILRKVRENKRLKHIPVHVMTAYDLDRKKMKLVNEFLPKPVTLERLSQALFKITPDNKVVRKVLVVEDNKVENDAVCQLLSNAGLQYVQAFDAAETLEILSNSEADAIILDLMLPDSDGYDLMKKIRTSGKYQDIPIIIYSGKDISLKEDAQLKKYANTIIIKNEYSYQRLMDEVKLFLHNVNQKIEHNTTYQPSEILKAKRVLITDDDIRNVYSIYNVLEREGMSIEVASNGKEALEKLKSGEEFDIVLMDIMMPEMDGIECTKKIRQDENLKTLPVIALTAKAMKEDREKCIKAGASDYIQKPVDIDKLLTLIRIWVYDRAIKK